MIPKVIHYCWFGRNPKPNLAKKCIKSWKRHCSDYEIIEWNEDNFDISACPLYVRQAYEAKKWAFVSDFARLKIVFEHGGIYLDTDVQLRKSLNFLLGYDAYFGFEDEIYINTGLGFGAAAGALILSEMMDEYSDASFVLPNGEFDTTTCPKRNTSTLLRHGLEQNNKIQILSYKILILPTEYLCPIDYKTGDRKITKNTISVHHFIASWQFHILKEVTRRERIKKRRKKEKMDYFMYAPNRFLLRVLGNSRYSKLKQIFKRN